MNTHHLVVDFGKYKGELWTRVPASYLRWLSNEGEGKNVEIAKAELQRRGTKKSSDIEITPHAIDRASQMCRQIWFNETKAEEGIYTWLSRKATEAYEHIKEGETRVKYGKMIYVFKIGNDYPILKTVFTNKSNEEDNQ